MPSTSASHSASILAVVVLYNCQFSQSKSVASLLQILMEDPELGRQFSLVFYDNSPQPQALEVSASFPIHYFHDFSNGGLASAYNFALARAESEQREWLLLLDQDTSLTREFMVELVQASRVLQSRPEVGAIVPKLLVNGKIDSPSAHLFDQIRRQFQRPEPPMSQHVVGVQQQRLSAYNSGSTLRVTALRSIGGFPAEFWLDFMDHAIFHTLFVRGYRSYVMLSTLFHDSSYSDIGSLPLWRLHNILLARTLYVRQNGNFIDRLLYRIWLLRHSRNLRQTCKDPRIWKEAVMHAVLLKTGRKDKRLLT